MLKKILKLMSLLCFSILFLNGCVDASEPVSGNRIAMGGISGLIVDDANQVWFFDGRKEPIKLQFITGDAQSVYNNEYEKTYYVLKKDGSLWVWGKSYGDQLGVETQSPSDQVPLRQLLTSVQSIAVTGHKVLAIKSDGSLWAWGDSDNPRDDGDRKILTTPRKIMDDVQIVHAHDYSLFALKKDGSLWGWGANSCGSTGDGTTKQRFKPTQVDVKNLQGRKIVNVATGTGDNYAITEDGLLWQWGMKPAGRKICMHDPILRPVLVKGINNVKDIAPGIASVAILKQDGTVWHLYYDDLDKPEKQIPALRNVEEISMPYSYFLARKKDGTFWTGTLPNTTSPGEKDDSKIRQIILPRH